MITITTISSTNVKPLRRRLDEIIERIYQLPMSALAPSPPSAPSAPRDQMSKLVG
jgi:hypothetical protein